MMLMASVMAGLMALLFGAGVTLSGEAPHDRAYWREQYRRPVEIPFPESNPYSEAKSRLGRMLFFDPILSGSQVRSCATCHNPGLSWGDGKARAIGEKQVPLPLRSPTLLNVAWVPKLGWDGHFRDLEAVAYGPITAAGSIVTPASSRAAGCTSALGEMPLASNSEDGRSAAG